MRIFNADIPVAIVPRVEAATCFPSLSAGPPNLLPSLTTAPVHPNETVELFGTGFGATTPALATGTLFSAAAPLAQPVTATVGGVSAPVFGYLILPGVYQFNMTAPNLPDGDAPVVLTIAGVSTPLGFFLNIVQ